MNNKQISFIALLLSLIVIAPSLWAADFRKDLNQKAPHNPTLLSAHHTQAPLASTTQPSATNIVVPAKSSSSSTLQADTTTSSSSNSETYFHSFIDNVLLVEQYRTCNKFYITLSGHKYDLSEPTHNITTITELNKESLIKSIHKAYTTLMARHPEHEVALDNAITYYIGIETLQKLATDSNKTYKIDQPVPTLPVAAITTPAPAKKYIPTISTPTVSHDSRGTSTEYTITLQGIDPEKTYAKVLIVSNGPNTIYTLPNLYIDETHADKEMLNIAIHRGIIEVLSKNKVLLVPHDLAESIKVLRLLGLNLGNYVMNEQEEQNPLLQTFKRFFIQQDGL